MEEVQLTNSLVEDIQGFLIPLNVETPCVQRAVQLNDGDVQLLYPLGSTMTIKEPSFRHSLLGAVEMVVGLPWDIELEFAHADKQWAEINDVRAFPDSRSTF